MQTRRLSAFQTSLRPSLLLSAGHTAIDRYLLPAGLTAAGLLLWAHADTAKTPYHYTDPALHTTWAVTDVNQQRLQIFDEEDTDHRSLRRK